MQDMHRTLDDEVNATCLGCKLEHRYTYFMTVRVWNKAGLFNLATSEGVTADLTAPVGGRVSLTRAHMSCVGSCRLMAEFSGFIDEETGVEKCEFSIKTVNDVTVIPVQPTISENQIEVNQISLDHGKSYKIAVACYNSVGERSEVVFSPPLRIDNTPPEKVRRVIQKQHPKNEPKKELLSHRGIAICRHYDKIFLESYSIAILIANLRLF